MKNLAPRIPSHRDRGAVSAVSVGDYLCSKRALYRVEQLVDEHALIEDCRTGELIDAPVEDLHRLDRVRAA
ncbi:MAG: hypothetical protein WEB79_08235 [Thermoleophilaceae bacterium]